MAKSSIVSHFTHDDDPEIISHGRVAGKTVSEWTQDWYTWAMQAPSAFSPFTPGSLGDGTGGFDAGKMFFIGGYDTSKGPLDVTIPFGKPILVPLLNYMDTLDTKAVENGLVSDFKNGATSLFAILDGEPLHHLQADFVQTSFFSAGPTLPGSWANEAGVAVGTALAPTKGAGFWIVIEGLSKGNHTLEFGGTATSINFSAHTTDNIHIV